MHNDLVDDLFEEGYVRAVHTLRSAASITQDDLSGHLEEDDAVFSQAASKAADATPCFVAAAGDIILGMMFLDNGISICCMI